LTEFFQNLYNSLGVASIYLLVALGITLVYGLTRLVNFAQGEMVTLGAFVSYEFVQRGFPLVVALVLSTVLVGLASEILDIGLFRRTVNRPFNGLVISLGLIVALEGLYALIWPRADYQLPQLLGGHWEVFGLVLAKNRLLLVIITAVVAVLLLLGLRNTQIGRGVRAIAENRTATRVLGVPVGRLTSLTFMVGSGLGALAGGLLGTLFPFNAYFGGTFLLDGFAVAIVGGLGNVGGAVIAALILAVSETLGSAYISLEWAPAVGLVAIIVVLLVRPHGILRGTEAGDSVGSAEAALAFGEDPTEVTSRRPGERGSWREWITDPLKLTVAVCVVVMIIAPLILPTAKLLSNATYAVLIAIATYGVWFMFRFGGIITVVQAALMGVGGYTAGLTAEHWGWNFWFQLALAIVLAAAISLLIGLVALRTSGSYFLIVLFAFSELAVAILTNWVGLTGGIVGLIQTSTPDPLGGAVDFSDPYNFYWLALFFLFVTVFVMWRLTRSEFGRRLVTVRDNEVLARSLGLDAFRHKLMAFTICGATGGLAGVLLLYQQTAIAPPLFGTFPSVNLILVMMVGGLGVISGPALGAAVFVFLPEVLGLGPNATQLVYGLLLIAVIVFAPRGLGGSLRRYYTQLAGRRAAPPPQPPVQPPAERVRSGV
jgi:branched-chain amino acid transport system permease protein